MYSSEEKKLRLSALKGQGISQLNLPCEALSLFMWLLNKCLLMVSRKQLGIGRTAISLESTGQKAFGPCSSQLNEFVKGSGGFHLMSHNQ